MSQLRASDKKAFTTLYQLHSKHIYLNLLRLVKIETIAEEILQDIFVLIWEKRETIFIEQSFNAYLIRIAENKVFDFFRKVKRDRNIFDKIKEISSATYTHIEESIFIDERSAAFQVALNKLPPQRKQVFCLCKIEGKSYNEVSNILGISTSTINDHIVKATRTVKEVMMTNKELVTVWLLLSMVNYWK
ncbi:MAG: sigma-70 family RNA polymerase sigma factor [Agriterribacter sp.]